MCSPVYKLLSFWHFQEDLSLYSFEILRLSECVTGAGFWRSLFLFFLSIPFLEKKRPRLSVSCLCVCDVYEVCSVAHKKRVVVQEEGAALELPVLAAITNTHQERPGPSLLLLLATLGTHYILCSLVMHVRIGISCLSQIIRVPSSSFSFFLLYH